jgi:enamine deaminase RidA (YjgF/YER057c/UK114 family)
MSMLRKLLLAVASIVCATAQAQNKYINLPGLSKPTGYTHVVIAGNTIYIAGQVANNEKGEVVGKGDLDAQARRVYENLKICLQAAGASFNDVVKMNTYVVNYKPENIAIIRNVRKDYVPGENPPASTLVGVQALANPDFLIEVEAVAVRK